MATRKGFGQVEPNHLSARYTGQIYAQLPAKDSSGNAITQLENGQFLKYDYANARACNSNSVAGEWMLVFNEEKLYDERHQNHKDFVLKNTDFTDGLIYPRLLKINIGDIFTTNTFKSSDNTPVTVTSLDGEITLPTINIGDYVVIDSDGWLKKWTAAGSETAPASGIAFKVVPHFSQSYNSTSTKWEPDYTLPDKQWAAKLQRVQ